MSGQCFERDRCVCGGYTPGVRATCSNWIEDGSGPRGVTNVAVNGSRTLRDEFALAWLPHAINQAIAGYNHVCPTVIERAQQIAYEAADAMLKVRAS